MGVDAGDFDNSGTPGPGHHELRQRDDRPVSRRRPRACTRTSPLQAGVGAPSRNTLGFGCAFVDVDLDGALDLVVANGHIDETVRNIRGNVGYAQPPQLFLNQGNGTFRDVAADAGREFAQPRVGRGLACGDFDRDGDVDLLMTTNNGPAFLFRNDQLAGNRSVAVSPDGHEVESRRHRRHGAHLSRRHVAVAAGEERIELSVAVGAAGDVRRRASAIGSSASSSRGRAGGPRSSRTSRPGKAYDCVEGKGMLPS